MNIIQLNIPPDQINTEKFPVFSHDGTPYIDPESWKLRDFGLVERELDIKMDQFLRIPRVSFKASFHCVTGWTRLHNVWEGILLCELLKECGLLASAKFIFLRCTDGYSTNVPLTVAIQSAMLFANKHDGECLTTDHGGPVRVVLPSLYGWKSAKWIRSIEVLDRDKSGYWESRGYHSSGNAWKEERFWEGVG